VGRLLRTLTIAALALALAAAIAGATSSGPLAISCTTEQYKPKEITLACADDGTYLARLHWSKWSSSRAFGKGRYSYNDCTPSCASGHIHSVAVKVTLTHPKRCPKRKHKAFTHLSLAFHGTPPQGAITKMSLPCP
jgi:hypothetical protein